MPLRRGQKMERFESPPARTVTRHPRRVMPAANAEVLVPAAAEAAVGEGLPLRAAAAQDDLRRPLPLRRRLRIQLLLDARTNCESEMIAQTAPQQGAVLLWRQQIGTNRVLSKKSSPRTLPPPCRPQTHPP